MPINQKTINNMQCIINNSDFKWIECKNTLGIYLWKKNQITEKKFSTHFLSKRVLFFPRTSLPVPGHSEVNLCSMTLQLGKDISKTSMPVIFNEPLSFLQRVAEYMEYAVLLKQASQQESSILRLQVREELPLNLIRIINQ